MIRCIAIDDEPLALDKIREYIKRIGYLNLLDSFDNALDAINFMKTNKVDLIFLDIQMEELTGIQMLESLSEKPKVILTTAYDEYALKGYELDVCDYLLKPISFQRFLRACEKVCPGRMGWWTVQVMPPSAATSANRRPHQLLQHCQTLQHFLSVHGDRFGLFRFRRLFGLSYLAWYSR